MRKPIVAGLFYAPTFTELDKQIANCFTNKFGPGALPLAQRQGIIKGLIVPHAGYQFSGPCAAWAYKELAESEFADLHILLGTDHTGSGTALTLEDWETPFGSITTDQEFAQKLIQAGIKDNKAAHQKEHSIEVQLPFLQFISQDNLKNLKIIAINISHDFPNLADKIFETIKKTNKKICLIASSDFTHYGLNYGYLPFHENIKENLEKLDKKAINLIKKTQPQEFLHYCQKTGATICGQYAIAVLLELMKKIKIKESKLLRYYCSGDIIGDYSNSVSYASLTFK